MPAVYRYVDEKYPAWPSLRKFAWERSGFTGNHVSPTQYRMYWGNGVAGSSLVTDVPNTFSIHHLYSTMGEDAYYEKAHNSAYERLVDDVNGENSSLGVFFAEWREGLGMVANRLTNLYQAARALRRGNFPKFLKHLRVNPKRKHRGKTENALSEAPSLWLEYWFGWSPSVDEIWNLANRIAEPLPYGRFSGSARDQYRSYFNSGGYGWDYRGTVKVKTGCDVRVVNPNLYLANQLGVLNPLQIGWELVPFSFVVDWFTGFGDTISSVTDWCGLEVSNAYRTVFVEFVDRQFYPTDEAKASGVTMVRRGGLRHPTPRFRLTGGLGNSVTRAATAASLLTLNLRSMRG